MVRMNCFIGFLLYETSFIRVSWVMCFFYLRTKKGTIRYFWLEREWINLFFLLLFPFLRYFFIDMLLPVLFALKERIIANIILWIIPYFRLECTSLQLLLFFFPRAFINFLILFISQFSILNYQLHTSSYSY